MKKSSGNLFQDMNLEGAENLKIRSQLMIEIRRYVESSGLTQVAAAKVLGTTQSRLNEVIKGRIEKCTIDRLINMLTAVGYQVDVKIREAA